MIRQLTSRHSRIKTVTEFRRCTIIRWELFLGVMVWVVPLLKAGTANSINFTRSRKIVTFNIIDKENKIQKKNIRRIINARIGDRTQVGRQELICNDTKNNGPTDKRNP